MGFSINEISLDNIDQIKITPKIANQSAGRKFEVFESVSHKSTLCTMNKLYLRAVELYTETHDSENLKKLDAFIFKLFDAEDAAAYDYSKKGTIYKIRTFFHRLLGGSYRGTHTGRLKKLLFKMRKKKKRIGPFSLIKPI